MTDQIKFEDQSEETQEEPIAPTGLSVEPTNQQTLPQSVLPNAAVKMTEMEMVLKENERLKKLLAKRAVKAEVAPFDPSVPRPQDGSYIDAIDPLLAASDSFDPRRGHLSSDLDTRDMASRDNEDRKNHFRKVFSSGMKGKTYIAESEIPEGEVYGYKAITVKNHPLNAQINEAKREGWMYIPPSRHPDRITDLSADFLEIEGLVMMKREKYIHDLQLEVQHDEMAKQSRDMARYVTEGDGDPTRVKYRDPGQYSFQLRDAEHGGYVNRGGA